jgi:hypothetical protein
MGSSHSHNGCIRRCLGCIARKQNGKKCRNSVPVLGAVNAPSKQNATTAIEENSTNLSPEINSPGNDLNGILQKYAQAKPIEVDSKVEAAEAKYMLGNYSISTACDEMDIDVVDATLIDDTSDTEPNADIDISPHFNSEDLRVSPRSPKDHDTATIDDMDLSEEETHVVPQPLFPSRPPPRLQPQIPHPGSAASCAAQRYAASPDRRGADDTTAHPPRHRPAAAQGGPRHAPRRARLDSAPSGNDALDSELDAVMHNWRLMHGIAGRRAAAPPSPLAPGSTHASFQLAA